ncbi:FAD-dependent oxidoreductase [bacterium]|nr:MAG: FAD-dependent oxidoreductase [bacterium]
MNASTGLNRESHEFDVCVIGGGMAGLCAAIASARGGAKTALLNDRPVLGGNASSEVRMWICGAHGKGNKETGILEEIQLENLYRNPSLNYSVWDSVLWGAAAMQPNLTLILNASCADATMQGESIESVRAWQSTTQTWHHIAAHLFIDCSGDSILAALTPAEFRRGREAREEFGEDIQPERGDQKTMGNSLLIQIRRTDEPQPFIAPYWAYRFSRPEDLPNRMRGVQGNNFWWIEIGGLKDTIKDAEHIGSELHRITYGVWDYIKNRAPENQEAANWALEWVGSLPGKRESRRYVGDHILTQNDVRDGGKFDDIIAYGGWSMDDHHPAGLYFPGPPTIFHPAPSPYGIPYRSLYSRNVPNLLFAGRNISVTHAALSSTRVMATCALIGQAAGTAAAQCIRQRCQPRDLSSGPRLRELQQALMTDDCWLPGLRRQPDELAMSARLCGAGETEFLRDGFDRNIGEEEHTWIGEQGATLEYQWKEQVNVQGVRLVLDSNLNHEKRMPASYPQKGNRSLMPSTLLRRFRLETLDSNGNWHIAHEEANNSKRLVEIELPAQTKGLRLIPEQSWGEGPAHISSFEPLSRWNGKIPRPISTTFWSDVVTQIAPEDLEPPAATSNAKVGSHSA